VKRTLVAVALAAALVAGCSSKSDKPTAARSTTTTEAAAPAATGPVFPYLGTPGDNARSALVVKIDNAPKARPQFGLGSADIVVEEGVEGGITRFATIFQSKDAPVVGPVRSARTSDLHIAVALGKPLFAYSGTNSHFQALIDRSPLINLSPNKAASAYHRDSSRPAPYNLFSSTQQLYAAGGTAGSSPQPLLSFDAAATPATGDPVTTLMLHWKDPAHPTQTDVTWTWNGATPSRVENGTPQGDAGGAPVAPVDIVVMFVDYVDTGERDQSNSAVPEAKVEGSGEAWVIRGGKLVKGTWNKQADESPIDFRDTAGKKVLLTPGQTWIELPMKGNASVG
jgi:hypothetical protein